MHAWSVDYLTFKDLDRCGHLFLLGASLVVGLQAWSLDDFIFNDVARWARLLL